MLQEDLNEMLRSKVEKLYEEMIRKRVELAKRRSLIDVSKADESHHNQHTDNNHIDTSYVD